MTNLFVREWLNGGLIPLLLCVEFVIGYSIYNAYKSHGRDFLKLSGVSSAIALFFFFLGELARTVLAWIILHEVNTGERHTFHMEPLRNWFYVGACMILLVSTLRLVYTLGPKGHSGWIAALVFTVVFIVGLSMY